MGEDRISEIINSPKNFLAEAYISHGLKVCRFHITTAKSAHLMGIAPGKYYTITTGRLNDIVETGDISDCLSELLTPLLEPFYGGKLCVCGIGNRNLAVDSLGPETVRRIPLMWLEEPAMKCRFSKVVAITPDVQTNTNINTAAIIRSVSNSVSANCILAIDVEMCSHYEDLCATIHISDRGLKISNRNAFQRSIFLPGRSDGLDRYRAEYNQMLMDKAVGSNGMVQDRYITTTARFRQVEEARSFYARVGTELSTGLGRLGSSVRGLDNAARLQVLHDFFRSGEEGRFSFDLNELIRRGRDFRDLICPDSIQFKANHFLLGESRYGRVLFLKEYASILPDSLIPELADLPKNLMLSIDIQPVPTDTALRDIQRTTMAVESDMTRWQRRQNENYNFSADPPYDLRQMREVTKAYLDDLTTRDQRMMLVTITLTHLADSLEELDSDTAALTAIGNKYGWTSHFSAQNILSHFPQNMFLFPLFLCLRECLYQFQTGKT